MSSELPQLRGVFEMKPDALFAKWTSRYFSLEGDKLFYYKSKSHLEHLGCIDLHQILSVKQRSENSRNTRLFVLQIVCLDHETIFLDMVKRDKLDRWIIILNRWIRFFEAKRKDDNDLVRNSIRLHNQRMLSEIDAREGMGSYMPGIKDAFGGGNSHAKTPHQPLNSPTPAASRPVSLPVDPSQGRIELLEDLLQKQILFIEEMGSKWANAEDKHQDEMEELSSKFHLKKKQFELLLERKDHALANERNLRWKAELEVAQAKEQIQKLQERCNQLEHPSPSPQHCNSNESTTQATASSTHPPEGSQQQKYFIALGAAYKTLYNKYNDNNNNNSTSPNNNGNMSINDHENTNKKEGEGHRPINPHIQELKSSSPQLARSLSLSIKRNKAVSPHNSGFVSSSDQEGVSHHNDDDDIVDSDLSAAPSSLPEMDLALLFEAAMADNVPLDKVDVWLETQLQ